MLITNSGGFLRTNGGGVPVSSGGGGGGSFDALTVTDLTFIGQQGTPDLTYANMAMALRYVGGERRFLMYQFNNALPDKVGDLIEYKVNTSGLKNGGSDWTIANVPALTEVRRWSDWSTRARMVAGSYGTIFAGDGGNGVWPASFYWDEAHGLLWYTWQPQYPGGSIIWPVYNAVYLDDAEAGGSVSSGNIYGPYYFRDNTVYDDFKDAAAGIIPIPTNRQAAMGGKYLIVGHHGANNGGKGPHGVGMWVVDDLPSPPAQDSELWPTAVHIYDTSTDGGASPIPNMKAPNVSYQAANHASQGVTFYKSTGGVASVIADGDPIGLSVNDCLYQHDYGSIDCITVYMNSGASGGTWVPEIYNGFAWVQPSGWAVAVGSAVLSGTDNVFYWPKTTVSSSAPDGLGTDQWVRLRRTVAGSSGGSIRSIVTTTSVSDSEPYPYRPLGAGGYDPLGSEQYDASHYSYMYEEGFWGGAWVQTDNVEGLAYFGPLKTGGQWYGAAPAYMQPYNGGVPVKLECATVTSPSYGNGGKTEGPAYPFFFHFSTDELIECAAGTRARNNTGLNPTAFFRLSEEFPGIIKPNTVPNSSSPYYGEPTFNLYGTGHCVVFDPVTKQLIVWMTNGSVWSANNILAFFQVR